VLVRPIGDQGTRKGSPADRPEPTAEHQGGTGLWSGEAGDREELEEALQVLDEIHRCTGVDIAPIMRSSRAQSPIVIPRRDADTQTECTDVNPVPCDDTHGPRCDDRLGRIEHMVEDLRQVQFQESSRRKRAQKARKRREKRRRKRAVLVEGEQSNGSKGPADVSAAPDAGVSQPPMDVWEPPIEESGNGIEGGGEWKPDGRKPSGGRRTATSQSPPQSHRSLNKGNVTQKDCCEL
jgi:hypothetical protein